MVPIGHDIGRCLHQHFTLMFLNLMLVCLMKFHAFYWWGMRNVCMYVCSNALQDVWDPLAENGEYFDVFEYSSYFTLDVILRCAYSRNLNVLIER